MHEICNISEISTASNFIFNSSLYLANWKYLAQVQFVLYLKLKKLIKN
jgi:hypothetical protein